MPAAQILHIVKGPLHSCVQAMLGRRLYNMCNKELHVSCFVLNSDHGKQLTSNINVMNTFDNEKRNAAKSRIRTKLADVCDHKSKATSGCIADFKTYYKAVSEWLDMTDPFTKTFSVIKDTENSTKISQHVCELEIKWPENKTFSGVNTTKLTAESVAVTKCLQWLKTKNRIHKKKPKLFTKEDCMRLAMIPGKVNVDKRVLAEVKQLLEKFDNTLKDKMAYDLRSAKDFDGNEKIDIIDEVFRTKSRTKYKSFRPLMTPKQAESFDNILLENLCTKQKENADLPIIQFQEQILETLESERVMMITGPTACGKSTQVPQFIMNRYIEQLRGSSCNILISQPRRLAAVSLAQRVAAERDVVLGDGVGYEVRLDEVPLKRQYGMLFCTTGILLKHIVKNPQLTGITHVIVDEIHERRIDVDFILLVLKQILNNNPNLKVVLMSATADTELFQRYFNCPLIQVPGITHPVEMNFLEDIAKLSDTLYNHVERQIPDQIEFVVNLIRWIHRNKPPGAILCFLPGWTDICAVERRLKQDINIDQCCILKLHSMLPNNIQYQVFDPSPPGIRKVILSTDIAETSITIPDIVYVVDTSIGKVKYVVLDGNLSGTKSEYISQSAIQQRKGRAGRVQPGVSYHMITKQHYNALQFSAAPEILQVPLEWEILRSKQFGDMPIAEFFKQLISPPDEKLVKGATKRLISFGAIREDESLTPLGMRLLHISTAPDFGKAVLFSAIFECMSPILALGICYRFDDLFATYNTENFARRVKKAEYEPYSDHAAMYNIIAKYIEYYQNSQMEDAADFCSSVHLSPHRMEELYSMMHLHRTELKASGMIDDENDIKDSCKSCEELWRGLILTATDNILVHVPHYDFPRNRATMCTKDYKPAAIASVSVCYGRQSYPSKYLISTGVVYCSKRRSALIIDASCVSPLTVLLFYNSNFVQSKNEAHQNSFSRGNIVLTDDITGIVNLEMTSEEADILLRFRRAIIEIRDYYIFVQGHDFMRIDEEVAKYKADLLKVLCTLLDDAYFDTKTSMESTYGVSDILN